MKSIPEIYHEGQSERKYYIRSSDPNDIIKIAKYLLLINRYSEEYLKGNALDKSEQFCKYIEYGGKWYFKEEVLEDIKEAIEILWPKISQE